MVAGHQLDNFRTTTNGTVIELTDSQVLAQCEQTHKAVIYVDNKPLMRHIVPLLQQAEWRTYARQRDINTLTRKDSYEDKYQNLGQQLITTTLKTHKLPMPQAASVMKTLFRQHYVGPTMATYKASATARKNKVARIAPEDIVAPNCPLCNSEPDSLEHIVLRCDAAVLGDITKKMTTAMNTITGDDTRTRQLVFTMKQVLADAHTTDDMYEAACGVLTGHAAAHFESLLRQHYNSDTNITLTVKEVKLLAQILAIKFRHAHTRIKAHRAACTDKLGHHENRIRLGLEKLANIPQPAVVTRPPRQHDVADKPHDAK